MFIDTGNMTLLYIIISTTVISLGALVGVFALALKEEKLQKILVFVISLSTGFMIGGAFIHLLPEASELLDPQSIYQTVLLSFITFLLLEKIVHWRHCHDQKCDIHTFGYMNLIGDAVHNFIDGLVIASAFVADVKLGVVTSLAIAMHEIPQEIGDFGVLLSAGFSRRKALTANFMVALTALLGGIVGYLISFSVYDPLPYLLPFAAGGFIYIAASDLIPEMRKETDQKRSLITFSIFILGILLMWLLKFRG
jgi:zinc and cadmium transporter